MTTFDEEMMRRALQEAAGDFLISGAAVDKILDEARESAALDESPRIRAFIRRNGRVRSTLMAAAACIVILAVAVPLFNAESGTNNKSALKVVHGAYPVGGKTLIPSPRTVTHGEASVSGQFAQVVTTGTPTLSLTAGKAGKNTNTSASPANPSVKSSLRVEEVGSVELTVGNDRFQSTLTQLTGFATTDGGFVASTQSHVGTKTNHSYSTGTVVLSVPEHNFTNLVDQVRRAGDATAVDTSATDVTGQYVDLQARIRALEVSRTQYLKIMSRTNSIGGILSVQERLDSIQSQIEQLQAQLNLLNSETTYATLTVSLSVAGHHVVVTHHPRTGLDKAWHESLHGFAAGVEWLIRIAGPLLFTLLLLAALLFLGRWTWRATERRRNGIG
jgi:hypothetical protein